VLGAFAAGAVRRIVPPSLSPAAVAGLTDGTGLDAATVHQLTAGSPFFVSEVLAVGGSGEVPDTVVDAVLARPHRLDPVTQRAPVQLSTARTAPSGTPSARECRSRQSEGASRHQTGGAAPTTAPHRQRPPISNRPRFAQLRVVAAGARWGRAAL
jgi:hypothetical protein